MMRAVQDVADVTDVGQFSVLRHISERENSHTLLRSNLPKLRFTVGIAGVVEEARIVSNRACIDYKVVRDLEKIILLIPGHLRLVQSTCAFLIGDHLATVFNDQRTGTNVFLGDQTKTAIWGLSWRGKIKYRRVRIASLVRYSVIALLLTSMTAVFAYCLLEIR